MFSPIDARATDRNELVFGDKIRKYIRSGKQVCVLCSAICIFRRKEIAWEKLQNLIQPYSFLAKNIIILNYLETIQFPILLFLKKKIICRKTCSACWDRRWKRRTTKALWRACGPKLSRWPIERFECVFDFARKSYASVFIGRSESWKKKS